MKSSTFMLALFLGLLASPMPGVDSVIGSADAAPRNGLSRCVSADGISIFTDQRCSDLQVASQANTGAPLALPEPRIVVRSCAKNQDDLLFGVRSALENRDANRLADYYDWAGMGTAAGYRLMDRLLAFSERPLSDVQLVLPEELEMTAPWDDDRPSAPAVASLLRVDQLVSTRDFETSPTYFHLHHKAGCWWMQF
jgi:hypothetical protein